LSSGARLKHPPRLFYLSEETAGIPRELSDFNRNGPQLSLKRPFSSISITSAGVWIIGEIEDSWTVIIIVADAISI